MLQQTTIFNAAISPADVIQEIYAGRLDELECIAEEFRRTHPEIKKFSDLKLPKAGACSLAELMIDPTLQRKLAVSWYEDILTNFNDAIVQELNVFLDPAYPGKKLTWNGQHTLNVLYTIAVHILGEDPKDCIVPISTHQSQDRAVIRQAFIKTNSKEGSRPLTSIDLFIQKVHSVTTDGSDEPGYKEAALKYAHLQQHGIHLANSDHADADLPGALTRIKEVEDFPEALTKEYGMYYKYGLRRKSHRISKKESLMMFHFLALCAQDDNITVSKQYVRRLAEAFKKHFDADFCEGGEFWEANKRAYLIWHENTYGDEYTPRFSPTVAHGMPYLIQQLRAIQFNGIPAYIPSAPYTVPTEELWS